ncbi:MAG: hypothetical protein DCC53_12400 [Chloroflexi bacterium]|nr:hypothetical protein [Anaerolineae bacterium]RIK19872.1 MAG: hypothetical protein DCC53_12400 [Chloroflexota bacterium]
MEHRLQKLLAQANYGSRRAAEDLITAGRVRVNGEVAQLGSKADPEKDVVTVDGQRVDLKSPPIYIAYNKPVNVLSATERQPGDDRPTVRDMVPVDGHLFLLGRLDAESEGLVVLTNDGDLTQALTHPRYEHTKTYQVVVYGSMDGRTADRWSRGVTLDEEDGSTVETAQCFVDIVRREGDVTILKVVMTEGRNRQIRRVAALLGYPVKRLVRTHIGRYPMGDLPRGEYVELKERDVKLLKTAAPELDEIRKIKGQENAARRREKLMAHTTASEEQIEEAKRNRLPPVPRRGKKYAARDAEREERTRRDDRPRRPGSSDRRGGPRDGKRIGPKPHTFRSRLMIDESGENTPGARRHRGEDIPEGFRSRNAEQDLPEGFRSRLSEADRPTRRVFRREGGYRSRDGEARGGGEGRPPRREGGYRSRDGEARGGGEGRPPRREGGYRSRDGETRGGGEGRPPRREGGYRSRDGETRGGGEGRPPRREGGYRSRDGEARGSGEGRPPRREGGYRSRDGEARGGGEGRPPRREGGYRSRDGEARGGEGRPPRREGGYRSRDGEARGGEGRPPRREGGYRSRDGEARGGEGRPPRREGGYRSRDGEARGGGEGRPPRREGGYRSRDGEARGGEGRPPRREGGYRSRDGEARGGGEGRPPRREGGRTGGSTGAERRPPPRSSGNKRPDRRDQSQGGDRPARRTKREDSEE